MVPLLRAVAVLLQAPPTRATAARVHIRHRQPHRSLLILAILGPPLALEAQLAAHTP